MLCGVSLLAELTYEKHPHVHYENWFGFYGFAAAATTLVLTLFCLLMRPLLWQDSEYYDD